MDAIILAAGKGTRLAPITDTIPKAMVTVAGRPIIDHILHALPDEITRACVVVSADNQGEQIVKYLKDKYPDAPISFIKQHEAKGTGHAFLLAGSHIKSNRFLVLNGDDIYDKFELTDMLKHPMAMAVHSTVPRHDKYLSINTDHNSMIINHNYPENLEQPILIGTGAYVLSRSIFHIPPVSILNGKEYSLPHAVLQLAKSHPIKAKHMHRWIQINDHQDLSHAEEILGNK